MMDEVKSYKTPGAFRAALEARLQSRARETGIDLQRLRRQVAFDRFFGRMFSKGPKADYPWVFLREAMRWSCVHTLHARPEILISPCMLGHAFPQGSREKREHVRGMLQQAAGTRLDDYGLGIRQKRCSLV